tara:strand:- start:1273 stop:1815 length:543 start_codon:yes stop_codon:yes gene_type:complete
MEEIMMTHFQKFDKFLNRAYQLCGQLAAFFIVLIVVLVLIRIGSRLIGVYVPGLSQLSGYCLALAGSLGLAYTFGEHGHIRVEMLIERLSIGTRFRFEIFVLTVATCFSGFVAFYVIKLAYVSYLFGEHSSKDDQILLVIPQIPFALGFTLFTICLFHNLIRALATKSLGYLEHKGMSGH